MACWDAQWVADILFSWATRTFIHVLQLTKRAYLHIFEIAYQNNLLKHKRISGEQIIKQKHMIKFACELKTYTTCRRAVVNAV